MDAAKPPLAAPAAPRPLPVSKAMPDEDGQATLAAELSAAVIPSLRAECEERGVVPSVQVESEGVALGGTSLPCATR